MPDRALRPASALVGGLLLALAVPVLIVAAAGGGEMQLGPLRLAFYDLPTSAFCVFGLALWLGRRSRGGLLEGGLSALSLGAFGLACLLLWSPPGPGPAWLEMRPARALIAGLLLLGLAALAGRSVQRSLQASPVPGLLAIGIALLSGFVLELAMVSADRAALGDRLLPGVSAVDGRAHPNLLLIVVDTLRADALQDALAQGARRAHSGVVGSQSDEPSAPAADAGAGQLPFFSGLATESLVFERAIAAAPWTVPSMMALMTGRYPSSLDPAGRGRAWPGGFADARPLDRSVPRLAEGLQQAGYSTAGLVKNPFLTGGLGLAQGFDVYERVHGDTAEHGSAGQLVNAALRWAEAMGVAAHGQRPKPWFLYLHFMDPHVNYQPPARQLSPRARAYVGTVDGRASTLHEMIAAGSRPAAVDVIQLKELYAAEVRYLDEQLARLFDAFTAAGFLGDDTCVVFTADHGEQFGEHGGWLHGDIHAENVRVPLILRGPGVAPGRRDDPVSLVDLVPTLAGLLAVPGLPLGDGRDLLAPGASRSELAVHTDYGEQSRLTGPRFSLLRRGRGQTSLYDLDADPGERDELAGSSDDSAGYDEIVATMLRVMEAHEDQAALWSPRGSAPTEGAAEIDADTTVELDTEALRAIGYIDG